MLNRASIFLKKLLIGLSKFHFMDVLRQMEPAAKPISESYSDATDKERTARQWNAARGKGFREGLVCLA